MKEKVTLQDIADRSHVSKALVSRVLNNRPVRVSNQKREHILQNRQRAGLYAIRADSDGQSHAFAKQNHCLAASSYVRNLYVDHGRQCTRHAYENGYSTVLFDYRQDSALEMTIWICATP